MLAINHNRRYKQDAKRSKTERFSAVRKLESPMYHNRGFGVGTLY